MPDTPPRRDGPRPEPVTSNPELPCDSTLAVLERAREGDESAARILMERALPAVRRWTHGRMPAYARGTVDTEDLVQDAVVRTLKRLRTFNHRTVGALQAYLRGAVVNRIRDLIRRSRTRGRAVDIGEDLPDMAPSPLETAILRERLENFLEALQRLSPSDRQVVVWRIELGYSADDIARRLGKSKGAAAMTLSRALARLQQHIRTRSK